MIPILTKSQSHREAGAESGTSHKRHRQSMNSHLVNSIVISQKVKMVLDLQVIEKSMIGDMD